MPPKRLRKKKPWILQEPDAPEVEPLMLTCPGCGREVEQTSHSCPDCDTVFYQRAGTTGPRTRRGGSRRVDPAAAEFGSRMEEVEKWTRVACVVGGILCVLYGLWQVLSHANVYAIFGCTILAIICFTRGLKGGDADLHILDCFVFWRRWRRW